jgi:hypothetical protein
MLEPVGGGRAVDAIAFNKVEDAANGMADALRFAYHLDVNEYRGEVGVQLRVTHWEAEP